MKVYIVFDNFDLDCVFDSEEKAIAYRAKRYTSLVKEYGEDSVSPEDFQILEKEVL